MPPLSQWFYEDRGHRWEWPLSELPRCTRCFAFEYQRGELYCPVPLARIPDDFAPRSRRRRALEKRLERRRVKLDDLRTFPDYVTCSACKRPTREAPAGLALGICTRTRWIDGADGPITMPNGRIISIKESADVCSGTCFDAIVADVRWEAASVERLAELAELPHLLVARGEIVCVWGGVQTHENVERVLAATRIR